MKQTLIGVVTADAMVVHGYEALTRERPGLVLLGTWDDLEDAREAWDVAAPDIAIVSSEILRPDPCAALGLGARRRIPLLVRHARPTLEYAEFVLAAGAQGVLDAGAPPGDLTDAVGSVIAGETEVPKTLRADLARRGLGGRRVPALSLSCRQREVLLAGADGSTAKEIGARLFMAPATVRTHQQAAFRTLGVVNRVAAARQLERLGFEALAPQPLAL